MAGFLLRRLVFGLVAMFAALSLCFFYFASKFFPLRARRRSAHALLGVGAGHPDAAGASRTA